MRIDEQTYPGRLHATGKQLSSAMITTRRDALQTLLAASIGAAFPIPKLLRASPSACSESINQSRLQEIRSQVHDAIAQRQATGVAIAVAHGGRIVLEEGFGWANRAAGVKVTPHTSFSLASLTKPFTTTALMTLVAEGKLSLDEPANRYLMTSKLEGINGDAEKVTVRLLGAHASGLPGMFESYDRNETRLALSPDALLRAYGRLAYPPRSCYEYSNLGFAALDAIASNLTGTDLGTLLQQRVLTPLNLRDTFYDTNTARLAGSAIRYDPLGHPIPYYTTSTPASGELYSSAHDLACFAMFTMKNHAGTRRTVLEEHWIDELLKPVFVGPSGIATTFGWFTGRSESGVPFVLKSGGQPGVATILYMVPSENLACLVLTNQSDDRELALSICDQLVRNYLPDWQQPREDSGDPPSPFVATGVIGQWEGRLLNGGADMKVRLNIRSSQEATFGLGTDHEEKISEMRSEGEAFAGSSTGIIHSPDANRTAARTLGIKLIPCSGKLIGRVFALSGDPDIKNVRLPFVLTLSRVSA